MNGARRLTREETQTVPQIDSDARTLGGTVSLFSIQHWAKTENVRPNV